MHTNTTVACENCDCWQRRDVSNTFRMWWQLTTQCSHVFIPMCLAIILRHSCLLVRLDLAGGRPETLLPLNLTLFLITKSSSTPAMPPPDRSLQILHSVSSSWWWWWWLLLLLVVVVVVVVLYVGPSGQSNGHQIMKIKRYKQLQWRVTQWVKYFGRRQHSLLDSHVQAHEQICCFLSVFCDHGDAPAYFLNQLDSHVVKLSSPSSSLLLLSPFLSQWCVSKLVASTWHLNENRINITALCAKCTLWQESNVPTMVHSRLSQIVTHTHTQAHDHSNVDP